MSKSQNQLYQKQFTSVSTKRFDDIVKYVQPRTYQDEDFQNEFKFNIEEVHMIKKTYEKFAYKQDLMDKRRFRNSLGILAMDNACFLADRLFDLMDIDRDGIIRFFDFMKYLDVIMNRDPYKKAEMSFKFIDRDNKGKIVYDDIEYLITKIALFWKELTGQTVFPQRSHIDEIFGALDPKNTGEVRLSDFQKMYYNQDCYFQWFEFFNQDELTENQIAKIENDEIIKQKDQLVRMEIETNLKNVEQEVTELIVQLNKASKKYKELLEVEYKQKLIYQHKLQQRHLIKLNQVQQDRSDIQLQQTYKNTQLTQGNLNQSNLNTQRSKQLNNQTPVQSPFTTANEEERIKLLNLKNSDKNKKNTFELVLHSTQTQSQQQLIQQTSLDKRESLTKKISENPFEFASSSSSSSVVVLNKKLIQKPQADPQLQNNNRVHPSIDFSTTSTLNINFQGKLQQPSSNGRLSIFNQTDNIINTLDQNKPKQNIFQPIDYLQDIKRNQQEIVSQRNNNPNNISSINPSSKRTSEFDQSSYYELNNTNYLNQQSYTQKQSKTTSFTNNLFSCGFQDIFEKNQLQNLTYKAEEDTESKKSKRRFKIFDSTPIQMPQIQQEIKFPSQQQDNNIQKQQEITVKLEQKFNPSLNNNTLNNNNNNNNISNNNNYNKNQITQNNYNNNNNNFNNTNNVNNNEQKTQQQAQNQQQNISNRSPLHKQAINKNQLNNNNNNSNNNNNGFILSPISNQFKNNNKSSISLHFGSQSDISLISGDLYNQPPVLNDVNGPVKINLPTEQNLGDNDPETEDDTDCNNNRSYLEQKFQMLRNQSSMNTNNSPKRNKSSFDPKVSSISGASSQTDVLSNQIKRKKKNGIQQHKKKSKSPPLTGMHRFKLDQSYDENIGYLDELKNQSQDRDISREDSQGGSSGELDEDDDFKSNSEGTGSRAVEFILEEYKKIEKQISEYVDLMEQYQKQLKELDEMILNSNKKKKDETKLPLKRQCALVNGQSSLPPVIDEESHSPSITSNQMITTKRERSTNLILNSNSNHPYNFNATNTILQNPSHNNLNSSTAFKNTFKDNISNENIPFPPSRYHTFSPQVANNYSSFGTQGSGNGLIHKKSLGQNESSSENLYVQNLRKSTIKNMPALLNDKENKSKVDRHRNLQLYIGHDNWNLVLEMMLVIRSAIKSLKKINHPALQNHGLQGTVISSMNTEGNYQNNQNNQSQVYQVSLFHPQNNNHSQNIQNNNPQQSTFSYLDNQFNPQTSVVFPEKKTTFSNFGNISGIYGQTMAVLGIPIELRTKDFETHNQQMLFNYVSNSNYHFAQLEYIDYCPLVFESLRRYQNISQERFLRSLGPENVIGNLIMGRMSQISELCRSSSQPFNKFQYYSECGSFIIKTIPEVNAQYFLKILPNYYQFILSQPNSLVIRIYGLYKLQVRQDKSSKKRNTNNQADLQHALDTSGAIGTNEGSNPHSKFTSVYFMVCQNVFNTNLEIKHRFEIKGSTRGRKAVKKNIPQPNQTLPKKELDWIDSNIRIRVDLQLKQQILNQLCLDAQFLSANKLLNYCALIGVHNFQRQEDIQAYNKRDMYRSNYSSGSQVGGTNGFSNESPIQYLESPFSKILSQDKKSIYFLGIINIFTEYTTSKKWIAMFKNPFLGKTQSTVDPITYSNRLLEFFQNRIFD